MGVEIHVNFDNPSNIFRPGQVITGNVSVNTSRQTVVRGLTLNFHGEGQVLWTETRTRTTTPNHEHHHQPSHEYGHHHHRHEPHHGRHHHNNHNHQHNHEPFPVTPPPVTRSYTVEYKNQETYLDNFFSLSLGEDVPGSTVELQAGYFQQIPFTFQLPLNIPTSGQLKHGSVKYFAEASLKVKQSLLVFTTEVTKSARKEFAIFGSLDLGLVHGVLHPTQLQVQKQFGILCCGSAGQFTMDLRMSRTGFVPGEGLVFQVDYENLTDVTVNKMEAYLTQTVQFITFGKEQKQVNKINNIINDTKIHPKTNGTWNNQLRISPTAYLTDLGGCRIILVRYTLTVKACASFGRSAKITVPITIGTMSGERVSGFGYN